MKTTLELLQKEFASLNKSFQIVAGFLTTALGLSALFMNLLNSKVAISLISIGAFAIAFTICRVIITAKRESFETITPVFSKTGITIAKICQFVALSILIPPTLFGFQLTFPTSSDCKHSGNMGLVITQFSENEHDPFSYNLVDKLESDLLATDSISIIRLSKFVTPGIPYFTDSLKNMFTSICSNHGLVVYGERSQESKSFVCNIYINNLPNLNIDRKRLVNKNIIFLRNPDVINFSVDSQSNAVSEFILGLLYFNSKDYSRSKAIMNHSLLAYGNNQNKKFSSYCHLYLGNANMMDNKYSEAIEDYQKGVKGDSLNAYLHYNLANALLSISKADSALTEYNIAQRLNDKLPCPIRDSAFDSIASGQQTLAQRTIKPVPRRSPRKPADQPEPSAGKAAEMSEYHIIVSRTGKYGLTSPKGDTLVPCEYDAFCNGEFTYRDRTYFIAEKDGKFGAIGTKGNIAIPFNHPSAQRVMAVIQILIDNNALE